MSNSFLKIDQKYNLVINHNIEYISSIFNNPKFIKLHSKNYEELYNFYLMEDKTSKCKGHIIFGRNYENLLINPINGSYGGFEIDYDINFQIKEKFINNVINFLETIKPSCIKITLPPDIYNLENNAHQLNILLRRNFLIRNKELNQYIDIINYDPNKSVNY